jgi:hypothetical protein
MIERLGEALRAAGFPCRVETRERLAIIAFDGGTIASGADRLQISRIAREHGFTHVALELTRAGRAPLPGDHA